ncbi:MAG: hypothetical protein HOM90_01565 [Porticoccaceae bacterium]|nr:hypothetical protein [Porticoccaceae bacterium]
MTDCDSNGQEWTPVGHIMVTVVSTVAGCNADGQGRGKPLSGGSIGSISAHYGCDAATKLSATTAEWREG